MSLTSHLARESSRRLDPKRIHKQLFGVYYQEDIFDLICTQYPRLARLLWWQIDPQTRAKRLIFIHVPRAAGMSATRALFGQRRIEHHSAQFYRAVDPGFFAMAESFAILRDPYERFISSYLFVQKGGTPDSKLSDVFRNLTADIRGVDRYLDFLERKDALSVDFVMRPQSWFVCDRVTGTPLPKRLFILGRDDAALDAFLLSHGASGMPWLNGSPREPVDLSPVQRWRIRAIYVSDFALIKRVQEAQAQKKLTTGAE